MLGSITIEIRTLNAVKKRTYFVWPAPLLPVNSGTIFFNSVEQVVSKTIVIKVFVEYQVPNFEISIFFFPNEARVC